MSSIDDIKSRLELLDIVSESVKLRRTGKNYIGFCPFHENSRTPAFVLFPDTGTWRCFGCNEGGDIFKFVMKKEGWDFHQALQYLAQRAGVELEPQTPEKAAEDQHVERLRTLLEEAVTFYRHHLLNNPAGVQAREYLERRGLLPGTIDVFELGFAPNSWDAALQYFREKEYSIEELVQVGLLSENQERGSHYDRFRNRLMFPIRDGQGRITGFGARTLDPDGLPKYLNSPQSDLFDKGRTLFGLNLARRSIRTEDQVVVVEGYLDVIVPYQAGFTNVVSPMGTALGENQLRQLKRLTRRIVLALDADAAGQKATLRGLEVARQSLDRSGDPVFDARGLTRYEGRMQIDLRVTTLPAGMDPDEVVLRDPQEWRGIIENARPVVIHVMETLTADKNLDDPKIKRDIAEQILPLIEDVPNAVERDDYRQRLARLLRIDERSLLTTQVRPARKRRQSARQDSRRSSPMLSAVAVSTSADQQVNSIECHILSLLVRHPEALFKVDRFLQESNLSRFSAQDFEQIDYQVLAQLIIQSLEQDHLEPKEYVLQNLPESVGDFVQTLLTPLMSGEPLFEKLSEDLAKAVLHLRKVKIELALAQLQFLQRELQAQGGADLGTYQEQILRYSLIKGRLDRALGSGFLMD